MALNLRVLSTLGSTIGGSNAIVVVGNKTCCFNDGQGRWVIEVAINKNMTDRDVSLIHGFIDHEAAHVRYTNWNAVETSFKLGEEVKTLTNILEDVRIEKMIAQRYPGSGLNLNRTAAKLCEDESFWAMPNSKMGLYSLVCCFYLYGGRYHLLKQLDLKTRASLAFDILKERVSPELYAKFGKAFIEMKQHTGTADALVAAKQIVSLLGKAKEEENANKAPSPGGKGDTGTTGSDAQGDAEGKSAGSAGDDAQGDAAGKSAGSAGDDAEGDAAGKSAGSAGDDAEGDVGEEVGDKSASNASGESSRGSDRNLWFDESGRELVPADICEGLADKLQSIFDASFDPQEGDPFQSTLAIYRPSTIEPCLFQADAKAVQSVQQVMNKWCLSFTQVKHSPRTAGHKLNTRRLASVPTGNLRVFDHATRSKTPAAAVQVLLDASGSMTSQTKELPYGAYAPSGIACASLVKALQGLRNFAVSVMQFNESINLAHDWDNKGPLSNLCYADGGTETVRACFTALGNLANRQESTKILFILTDGHGDLSRVLPVAEEYGVKICAIRFGSQGYRKLDALDLQLQPFCSDLEHLPEMFTDVLMRTMGRA
ncbi:Cobalamin biosynthesis protein CobT [compost metagenome]